MTPKTKEEKLALLEETVNFYTLNTRCTNNLGHCVYYAEDKDGCAVGRLIASKELCKHLDQQLVISVSNTSVFRKLPEEVRAYGQDFLYELQQLHDTASNWTPTGLSSKGFAHYNGIKTQLEAERL